VSRGGKQPGFAGLIPASPDTLVRGSVVTVDAAYPKLDDTTHLVENAKQGHNRI